jgi:hypothetical protein
MPAITGTAILGLRAFVLIQSLETYIKTDGAMQTTRIATPNNMRAWATEYTGKAYARSRKGLVTALADMRALWAAKDGNLAKVGDTREVNQLVGGVAADLQYSGPERRSNDSPRPLGRHRRAND